MFFRRGQHLGEGDLSAYLDGEMDLHRARPLAAHVQACPACRERLEELRQTKAMLASLPRAAMPRSFTLSPERAGIVKRESSRRPAILSLAPALTLSLLVALLVIDLGAGVGDESAGSSVPALLPADKSLQEEGPRLMFGPGTPAPAAARAAAGAPTVQAFGAPAPAAPPSPAATSPLAQGDAGAGDAAVGAAPQPFTAENAPGVAAAPPAPAPAPAGGAPTAPEATPAAAASPREAPATPAGAPSGAVGGIKPTAAAPSDASARPQEGGGISVLRALQVAAALSFAASLLIVAWPRFRGKGSP
jgi:anti-sigma factor RsiW